MQNRFIDKPRITADIMFLRAEEGGRARLPHFSPEHPYCPHIVVQSRNGRDAKSIDLDITDHYLGVAFVDAALDMTAGIAGVHSLRLIYAPEVDYSAVVSSTCFTVREGPAVVGHGMVIDRFAT